MTARTRLPTFLPISAVSRPGSIVPPITVGLLVKVLAFSEELVPSQKYRTKFAAMASLLVRVTPVPWMSVLTARSLPALAFGTVTVGVLPKDPLAMTDEFAVEEEDDEDDDDALDFDEPQPARTTQASRGTAMSARKRRMKTSMVVDVSFASLLEVLTRGDDPRSPPLLLPGGPIPPDPPWGGPAPPPALLQLRDYMPAMSFSTRSSTERNGSLHSTVRWAWSFSLRCTQSTVKSRRFSWARRMNSPRSLARVVCGGTDLASKMSMSRAARSTAPARCSR